MGDLVIHRRYTPLGNRIAELGGTQTALAKAMKISQQTISKKMRGEVAIAVSDLEKLAKHFKVPMTYFFAAEGLDGSILAAFHAMVKAKPQEVDAILDAFRTNPDIITHLSHIAHAMTRDSLRGKPFKRPRKR